MRRFSAFVLAVIMAASLFGLAACDQKKGGDPLVGNWVMVDNPSKVVSITKEGEQYFYTGSQGKTAANKVDENTLVVPMSGIEVTVKLDPASGELGVSFMGEMYRYKKADK